MREKNEQAYLGLDPGVAVIRVLRAMFRVERLDGKINRYISRAITRIFEWHLVDYRETNTCFR